LVQLNYTLLDGGPNLDIKSAVNRQTFFPILAILIVLSGSIAVESQAATPSNDVDWAAYNGSEGQSHYSPLRQITPANVAQLQQVWSYDTGQRGGLEANPLVIDGVLYSYTPRQQVIALNAATGKLLWNFDSGVPAFRPVRGLAYWHLGLDRRIIAGIGNFLYELDAATGKPIPSFGTDGRIDAREGLGRDPKTQSMQLTSPAQIYKDLIILGSATSESLPAAPGDIRAYDVHTGKQVWSFHTIPHPGEFGYDTWPKDAWQTSGAANNWCGMALDVARGIVYVPTGSASADWWGGDRLGNDLFANSLIALDAATGKRLWHFQLVHHDLWDKDFPSPPTLATVRRNGKDIPAIVQTTKQGWVLVFNRLTGESLFPIEERPVLQTTVPGEVTSPTQPFPLKPAPLSLQNVTENDLTTRSPEAHAWALEQLKGIIHTGLYTPNIVGKPTMMMPGWDGGAEWGGSAYDARTHVLYVNANNLGLTESLVKHEAGGGGRSLYQAQCAVCHLQSRAGSPPTVPSLLNLQEHMTPAQISDIITSGKGRMPAFAALTPREKRDIAQYLLNSSDQQETTASGPDRYDTTGYKAFVDPDGYPATAAPWGTLNAINLDTGEYLWRVPLGEYPALAAQGQKDTGSENYGGPVLTAGGVIFIASTVVDKKIRAFDPKNGKELWEATLPFSANSTPAVYSVGGREYVVIATGGGRAPRVPTGGVYVAFALPEIHKKAN